MQAVPTKEYNQPWFVGMLKRALEKAYEKQGRRNSKLVSVFESGGGYRVTLDFGDATETVEVAR